MICALIDWTVQRFGRWTRSREFPALRNDIEDRFWACRQSHKSLLVRQSIVSRLYICLRLILFRSLVSCFCFFLAFFFSFYLMVFRTRHLHKTEKELTISIGGDPNAIRKRGPQVIGRSERPGREWSTSITGSAARTFSLFSFSLLFSPTIFLVHYCTPVFSLSPFSPFFVRCTLRLSLSLALSASFFLSFTDPFSFARSAPCLVTVAPLFHSFSTALLTVRWWNPITRPVLIPWELLHRFYRFVSHFFISISVFLYKITPFDSQIQSRWFSNIRFELQLFRL